MFQSKEPPRLCLKDRPLTFDCKYSAAVTCSFWHCRSMQAPPFVQLRHRANKTLAFRDEEARTSGCGGIPAKSLACAHGREKHTCATRRPQALLTSSQKSYAVSAVSVGACVCLRCVCCGQFPRRLIHNFLCTKIAVPTAQKGRAKFCSTKYLAKHGLINHMQLLRQVEQLFF